MKIHEKTQVKILASVLLVVIIAFTWSLHEVVKTSLAWHGEVVDLKKELAEEKREHEDDKLAHFLAEETYMSLIRGLESDIEGQDEIIRGLHSELIFKIEDVRLLTFEKKRAVAQPARVTRLLEEKEILLARYVCRSYQYPDIDKEKTVVLYVQR